MSGSERYVFAGVEHDVERERLRSLERNADPQTISLLTTLGVAPGWRCLEVGAGAGSIARWLAERVGPGGHVVATDIQPRFLGDLQLPNVEVRRHDITADPIESDCYDLVHCRGLLMHLRGPAEILGRMAGALRPGGVLFVEESHGEPQRMTSGSPRAEAFNRVADRYFEAVTSLGVDLGLGRRLPAILGGLGLTAIGGVVTARVFQGGTPPSLTSLGLAALRKQIVATGAVTDAEVSAVLADFADPTCFGLEPSLISVFGRRPL
jgi:SAM-dependent methyltransferase